MTLDERAAIAMGWRLWGETRGGYEHFCWYKDHYKDAPWKANRDGTPERWRDVTNIGRQGGVTTPGYDNWRPSTDYNQAMMLRDECAKQDLRIDFSDRLREVVVSFMREQGWAVDRDYILSCMAHATAEQITQAAVEVLEGVKDEVDA